MAGRARDARVVDMRRAHRAAGLRGCTHALQRDHARARCVDLSGAGDIEAIQALIRSASANDARRRVDPRLRLRRAATRERRHPTRASWTRRPPTAPWWSIHWTYHRAVANSAALAAAGIVVGHTCLPTASSSATHAASPSASWRRRRRTGSSACRSTRWWNGTGSELLDLVRPPTPSGISRSASPRCRTRGRRPISSSSSPGPPRRGSCRSTTRPCGARRGVCSPARPRGSTAPSSTPIARPHVRRGGIKFFADGAGVASAMSLPARAAPAWSTRASCSIPSATWPSWWRGRGGDI